MPSLRYVRWTGYLLALGLGPVHAQDDGAVESAARVPERCIQLNRVSRTEVIDDRTLVFHMRGGREIYLNYLDRECPQLKREERFMYSPTTGNRLCSVDTITVLEQWGFGLTRGFTCRLGEFHPISEVELADLKRGGDVPARAGGDGGSFEVETVDPEELEALTRDENGGGDESADEGELGVAAGSADAEDGDVEPTADGSAEEGAERGRRRR